MLVVNELNLSDRFIPSIFQLRSGQVKENIAHEIQLQVKREK